LLFFYRGYDWEENSMPIDNNNIGYRATEFASMMKVI
jgi:hypothetical protein